MIWERSKKKENQQKQDSDMNMQIRTRPPRRPPSIPRSCYLSGNIS